MLGGFLPRRIRNYNKPLKKPLISSYDPSTRLLTPDSLFKLPGLYKVSLYSRTQNRATIPEIPKLTPCGVPVNPAPHPAVHTLSQSNLGTAQGQISPSVWKLSFNWDSPLAQGTTKPLTTRWSQLLKEATFPGSHCTEQCCW